MKKLKIWLPYVICGSGVDVFTHVLRNQLEKAGHLAVVTPFKHKWQYFPWRMRYVTPPPGTDIILANSWNGFAFKRNGSKLVTVEHLCVHDEALIPFRSLFQAIFHKTLVRYFESKTFEVSDRVVAVSNYTAKVVQDCFPEVKVTPIQNGIDTDFFCPEDERRESESESRPFRLLFVGNLSRRKGADLLQKVMEVLGTEYCLEYTSGLRVRDLLSGDNVIPLGKLGKYEVRDAFRRADVFLFPSRLEGLPLTVLEAMSCGTPVVTTHCSSMPEVIEDGVNGILCLPEVGSVVEAIKLLQQDSQKRHDMGLKARNHVAKRFNLSRMTKDYIDLFEMMFANYTNKDKL